MRAAREGLQFSLRAVENQTGISNAYLSQIESDKIKQPSPNMLYKLCEVYDLSYSEVMELAGYPVPGEQPTEQQEMPRTSSLGPITEEEQEALTEYLAFLRSKKSKKDR